MPDGDAGKGPTQADIDAAEAALKGDIGFGKTKGRWGVVPMAADEPVTPGRSVDDGTERQD